MPEESTKPAVPYVVPLLLIAAGLIAVVPWLHPNNTCREWLTKWGQLADDPMWLPIHQICMAGLALAGAAGLLLALTPPRSHLATVGGAALFAGYMILAIIMMIHASAVSTIGRAHNAAVDDPARRAVLRIVAEAFVSYDVAAGHVTGILLPVGAGLVTLSFARSRVFSRPIAFVLLGVCSIWGISYYVHGVGEWLPLTSLSLWLASIGTLLAVRPGVPSAHSAGNEHQPVSGAPQQAHERAAGRIA
jgi:hypothetical protein